VGYQYDANGNRTQLSASAPGGTTYDTNYTYDAQDRLLSVFDHAAGATDYTYDVRGLLTQTQQTAAGASDPHIVTTYAYDANLRVQQIAQRAPLSNPVAQYTYSYLPDGNIAARQETVQGVTRTFVGRGTQTARIDLGKPFSEVLQADINDLRAIAARLRGSEDYFDEAIKALLAYYQSMGQHVDLSVK
jgi:YD repeat-containing protein